MIVDDDDDDGDDDYVASRLPSSLRVGTRRSCSHQEYRMDDAQKVDG